jgi:hypothetical protein
LVSTGTGIETDSESLAAQIGLLKAIKDYDLKRIISFHSRVKRAEAFTTDMQNTMQWISDEHRPSGTLRTDFVSGNMPANKRKIKLDQLKALNADERGVLSNARCLSEGVDVPSLDGVAFIDPRSSQVDIIQAVGRAIRLSPDKKAGTIVLPVFLKVGEDAPSTIEASNFKPIWEVLDALKAHDDVLACELDQIRTEIGRKPRAGVSADSLRKISIDLPATVDVNFSSALRAYLVERVTDSWEGWFGKLLAYREQFDHCNVATGDADYRGLAAWVSTQRIQKKKGGLSKERIARLEEIAFVWDFQQQKSDETWMKWYRELEKYTLENGNPHVPRTHANTKLASWVWIQRIRRERDYASAKQLTDEQVELLNKLGFSWGPKDGMWMAQFEKLKEFKIKFGHCNVEIERKNYSALAQWLSVQRDDKKKGVLPLEHETILNELGVVWDVRDAKWRAMYEQLRQYYTEHGNSDVPHRSKDNPLLAAWIDYQRERKDKNALTVEQVGLLDEIGFTWKRRDRGSWEDRLAEVIAFKEKHGHCNIPLSITDPPKLGAFINAMRFQRNKGTLSAERIAKLDAVGFVWQGQDTKIGEDGMNEVWKHCFDELIQYKHLHGDFNVPYKFSENPKLSWWVRMQKKLYRNGNLHSERIRLLEAIGFEWESEGAGQPWEVRYAELLSFKEVHGNCDVAVKYQDNPSLGVWVVNQRSKKKLGKLTTEQVRLLNEIGFIWEKKKRIKSS